MAEEKLPRVVIVGAGFGGLEAGKNWPLPERSTRCRRPHQLPPLPAAPLSGRHRRALAGRHRRASAWDSAKYKNVEVILAEVQSIDVNKRIVHAGDLDLAYDYLILATGARHSYFGHPEWEVLPPA